MKMILPFLRIVSILYFIYKTAFSDSKGLTWLWEIETSSSAKLVADVLFTLVYVIIYIAFIYFHIYQAIKEINQKDFVKSWLRIFSIIFSSIFYILCAISLFNVDLKLSQVTLAAYLLEFYTITTIVGLISGTIVTVYDVKKIRQLKRVK